MSDLPATKTVPRINPFEDLEPGNSKRVAAPAAPPRARPNPFADLEPVQPTTTEPATTDRLRFVDNPPETPTVERGLLHGFKEATPTAKGVGAAALQPFAEYIPDLRYALGSHAKDFVDAYEHFWDGGVGHKALTALRMFGDMGMYVASPAEAAIKAFVSDPLERATKVKGLGSYLAEMGSATAQLFVDPFNPAALGKNVGTKLGVLQPTTPAQQAAQGLYRQGKHGLVRVPPKPGVLGQAADDIKSWIAPTLRGPAAKLQERLIRSVANGPLARAEDQAKYALEQHRKVVGEADVRARYAFRQAVERDPNAPLMPPALQPLADAWYKLHQKWETALKSIGVLKDATDYYYPHVYRFLDAHGKELDDEAVRGIWQQMSARPLRGSRQAAGLVQRTHPYFSDVLTLQRPDGTPYGVWRDAAGNVAGQIELRFSNPIDEMLYRLGGMQRYYFGTKLGKRMHQTGLLTWVPGIGHGPAGTAPLDDPIFKKMLPAVGRITASGIIDTTHFEAFDPSLRNGLLDLARYIRARVRSPLGPSEDPMMAQAYGYFNPVNRNVVSRFGSNDTVLMHELGHNLDYQYNLIGSAKKSHPAVARVFPSSGPPVFQPGTPAYQELENLGMLRGPAGLPKPGTAAYKALPRDARRYIDYISGQAGYESELIANLFHAYWHAPELLRSVAPNALAKLHQFLNANPDLKGLVNRVSPSLRMEHRLRTSTQAWNYISQYYPGVRVLGSWWAPEPMAKVFNNYVSKGFGRGNSVLDGIRKTGNALNMLQLGTSAYHLTFTSFDALRSTLSLGLQQALRGEFGRAAYSIVSSPVAPVSSAARGRQLWNTWVDPALNPKLGRVAHALESAGGRITMDRLWAASGSGSFWKALRGGYIKDELRRTFEAEHVSTTHGLQTLRGAAANPFSKSLRVLERSIDTTSDWLMGRWVPSLKAGVFRNMAEDWLRRNPNATESELSAEMIKIWDSVDNRLGQMTYDNLFWNRLLKDISHLIVRAVGWNLGSTRELGGGVADTASLIRKLFDRSSDPITVADFTHRMTYTTVLIMSDAFIGAVLNKIMTGENPKDWRDYFYPRTGALDEHGQPARVSIPSYTKDVFSFSADPAATAMNKMHPLWEIGLELRQNRDYFGGIIRDEARDDWVLDYAKYLGSQALPFSVRGMLKEHREGTGWFPKVMTFFGFVPAAQSIVAPERQQRFENISKKRARKAKARE